MRWGGQFEDEVCGRIDRERSKLGVVVGTFCEEEPFEPEKPERNDPYKGIELRTRVNKCPFCSSEDTFMVEPTKNWRGGVWIRCTECGLHGVLYR